MSSERYYETKGPRVPMTVKGLFELLNLTAEARKRIVKISFDKDQGLILGQLVELGLPGLLFDLKHAIEEGRGNGAENTDIHLKLCESNAWLRRKWNTAFLLSAIGTLMGVSITLTDPKRTEPVDAIVTHQSVSRTIEDAEKAILDLKTYEAHDFANHFELLLKPYREMADSLLTTANKIV